MELFNAGTAPVDLAFVTLRVGSGHSAALAGELRVGEYRVVCSDELGQAISEWASLALDVQGTEISSTQLVGSGGLGKNWARTPTGEYSYTVTPTPGDRNVFTTSQVEVSEVGWTSDGVCPTGGCVCDGRDWIELHNAGDADVYLAGWTLSSSRKPLERACDALGSPSTPSSTLLRSPTRRPQQHHPA